jgi:hypothetical protein
MDRTGSEMGAMVRFCDHDYELQGLKYQQISQLFEELQVKRNK